MNRSETPDLALDPDMTAQQLMRRSRRLMWLTLLPLLLLVVVLAAWQAWAQWRQTLASAAAEAQTQRLAFELVARDATRHVADLRHVMLQAIVRSDDRVEPHLIEALQPRRDAQGRADGYSLDALPPPRGDGFAQLLWPRDSGRPSLAVLSRLQTLSTAVELAHQRNPDLVWSYFFGWPDRHVVLYPWAPTRTVAEDQGAVDLSSAAVAWYGYEVATAGMPQANPARQPYWTAPYVDAGGKGLMVSHAAPVYLGDELRGIVGTDIRLGSLEPLLAQLPGAPWRAWVVDDRGDVLADRQQPVAATGAAAASAADGLVRTAERLPPGFDTVALGRAATATDGPVALAGHRVVALPIRGAPWTLVLAAPVGSLVAATLPEALPYTAIVLGLLLLWAVGQALLRQRLLTPVLKLLGYLQRLSEDAAAAEPALGPRWRPWVQRVRRNVDDMRAAARRERRADLLKSAIVDHAQSAVVVADHAGRIVEFNPSAVSMFGWSREQALGRTVVELLVPQPQRPGFEQTVEAMRRGTAAHLMGRRLAMSCLRADGRELPVELVPWVTEVEGLPYFTASITDQTAARAAAEVIERQRDALRQSEKLGAMGSLLAGVAHELNNPLAIVMGRASLLQEKTEGTPLESDAVRIRDAAERCGRIVRTFLNIVRQRPPQRAPVRLNDLARAAADMLGYTLRSHGITLELQLDDALPDPQADGDQLGQVVLNLIVNAQQALSSHAGPRRIVLSSGRLPPDASGAATGVWLRVLDSGPGVPDAVRDQVFEPFFTTKADGIGTGIGLSVSQGIAREHGGELVLEPSRPGAGASFLLTLPLGPATVGEGEGQREGEGEGEALAPGPPPPAAGGRILVVDDEADVAALVHSLLEAAGHEVATAASGQVALAMLEVARFDAVVSDLRMPDMDGAGLWRAIRERDPALARRVVFLTGDTLSPATRQFLDETGCARLEKPFSRDDLLALVGRTLQPDAADA